MQKPGEDRAPDAVHRRVDDAQLPGPSGVEEAEHGPTIGLEQLGLVDRLGGAGLGPIEIRERARLGVRGRFGYGVVIGRDHLGAVCGVDLVAVVGRWVVTGGDHHARGRPEMLDGKGGDGCRERAGDHADPHPRREGDIGDVDRELRRAVAGVAPDDEPADCGLGALVEQPARDTGGRLPDDKTVHPRRPGAERPAKARGPEAEGVLEAGPHAGGVPGFDQGGELVARRRVWVEGHPSPGLGEQIGRELWPCALWSRHRMESTPPISPARYGAAAAPAARTSAWSSGVGLTPAARFVTSEMPSTEAPR